MAEILAPGVALFDYDNDGDLDVYLVQGQMLGAVSPTNPPTNQPTNSVLRGRLYRNDLEVRADGARTLRFTDVTEASGIDARGYGMGVAAGDVDNDGCVDLYLTKFGSAQMFRNNCDGTFTDVTKQSGTDNPGWSVSAAFVDFDRDGWLDLYVGNYLRYSLEGDTACFSSSGARDYCTPNRYEPLPDRSVPKPARRHVRRCQRQGRHRPRVRAGARHRDRRFQRRRLDRHLRRQRRQGQPAVDQPAQRHVHEHRAALRRRPDRRRPGGSEHGRRCRRLRQRRRRRPVHDRTDG